VDTLQIRIEAGYEGLQCRDEFRLTRVGKHRRSVGGDFAPEPWVGGAVEVVNGDLERRPQLRVSDTGRWGAAHLEWRCRTRAGEIKTGSEVWRVFVLSQRRGQ
jgi:hypothetical protein